MNVSICSNQVHNEITEVRVELLALYIDWILKH